MFQSIINFLNLHTPLFYWTQSLWRDEAFSVWIAKDTLSELIRRTSGDFNPPLYYLLLHYWMKIFGKSEISLRGMSFLFFIIFLFVVYKFAKSILKSNNKALLTTIIAALNPMLVYFAFELRMYSLLTLLSTLSMYFFYQKKWIKYIISTALGLYTQPFMIFVLMAQNIYLLQLKKIRTAFLISCSILLLYLPWLSILFDQFKQSGPMWMYPVDSNLIFSVLGNLFFGYEGTPGGLWLYMIFASLIILIVSLLCWQIKKLRKILWLFYFWLAIPITLVLVISLLKPIYVHRYLIYTTVAEVFLISFFLCNIKNLKLQRIIGSSVIIFLLLINFLVVDFHRKTPIRDTFDRINSQLKNSDVIYAETPLVYFESLYYSPQNTPVYVYNPDQITPPRYTGAIGMPKTTWATNYPTYPERAFVVKEDGTFFIASEFKKL